MSLKFTVLEKIRQWTRFARGASSSSRRSLLETLLLHPLPCPPLNSRKPPASSPLVLAPAPTIVGRRRATLPHHPQPSPFLDPAHPNPRAGRRLAPPRRLHRRPHPTSFSRRFAPPPSLPCTTAVSRPSPPTPPSRTTEDRSLTSPEP